MSPKPNPPSTGIPGRAWISILGILAGIVFTLPARAALYDVRVEASSRVTSEGVTVAIDLFVPVASPGLPGPPWPAVVLSHGFTRAKEYHAANAQYMAQRGILVATPNSPGWFGTNAQQDNINALVGHVGWLVRRTATPGDSLYGLLDPSRIGLAGQSAGGGISFQAAVALQNTATPVHALCLLDAVPWGTTAEVAHALRALPFSSLRAEPSACNLDAAILSILGEMNFPNEDVRLVGANHCDPENPSDLFCSLTCGAADPTRQGRFQRLMHLFFQDALAVPPVEEVETYPGKLAEYETAGFVVRTPIIRPPDPLSGVILF